MTIREVSTAQDQQDFIAVSVRLYQSDPNWVRPLDKDIESVFDPKTNKLFRHGEAKRWVLYDQKHQLIGRIAAFVNRKTATKDNDQPTGGMGFFECINDQAAATLLLDQAKNYLQDLGMEAVDGPINFGDRDKWWGCLYKGFTPPNYCMPYNYPYYNDLLTSYGYQEYFKQYTYARKLKGVTMEPHVEERARRVFANEKYTFEHIQKSKLEKYGEDFRAIYNKAWGKHAGVASMSKAQSLSILKTIKPVIIEQIIWFAYYEGEPVAFFICLPELNQLFGRLNGKFGLLQKLKFLWLKFRKVGDTMFGVAFGVVPEHQSKGVEAAIIKKMEAIVTDDAFRYDHIEMNWIGDFNPSMMKVCKAIGGEIYKTHITYRYLFDRTKEFKRIRTIKGA